MKSLSFFLFFAALCLCGGEIKLSQDLPYTDASWFWTYNGYKQPQFNKNLSGNAISIGRHIYPEGICGHTNFSLVYNVKNQAEAFSCLIGLEDEDHPDDIARGDKITPSIYFSIKTDRQEVFRKEMKLGDAAFPVTIDLKGKYQIELRAEGGQGKSSHRFRPAFVYPRFTSQNQDTLRAALEKEKVLMDASYANKISYPPPPKWENIQITKTRFGSYSNAYRIDNGTLEVILVPEQGGRVFSFTAKEQENLLQQNMPHAKDTILLRGRASDFAGAHFMRPLPVNYFMPMEPLLENAEFTISFPAEGEIIMKSQISRVFLISYEYKIKIASRASEMEITNTIINEAPFTQKLGVWSLTRINKALVNSLQISDPQAGTMQCRKKASFDSFDFSVSALSFFPGENSGNLKEYSEVLCKSDTQTILAALKDSRIFKISYDRNANPLHLYCSASILEMEGHGPEKALKPDEKISISEIWTLTKRN